MTSLPAFPDLAHIKKQAKHLLRDARGGDVVALKRFIATLPAVRDMMPDALAAYELSLHDAQSVLAREYDFVSWTELKRAVEWKRADGAERIKTWLKWVFDGNARERARAAQTLCEEPNLFARDAGLACVIGNASLIHSAIAHDASWVNAPLSALAMPPLVAVTHSRLIQEEGFEAPLLVCAALLLEHGADVNGSWIDPRFPDSPLSALYGAVGRTRHVKMTKLLLDAGADPNDNESLYHSVESSDGVCTRLLFASGVRVTKTNAIARVLDYDNLVGLQLLLANGGDPNERPWMHHAILRGRSLAHVRALIDAGADPRAKDGNGVSLYLWAQMHGRVDVVALLRDLGVEDPLSDEELFVAAASRGDEMEARTIQERTPDIVPRLTPMQLKAMPELADVGDFAAVRTMLALGWPCEVKAAWDATALNLAVFRGDAAMATLLLRSGADWRTRHGVGDNVLGTLSFASQADDIDDSAPRDYVGCAEALRSHGVPRASFQDYSFSDEVTAFLETLPTARSS